MGDRHQVVTKLLNSSLKALTVVAGKGCPGSGPNMLYSPRGIFVDINFDLYVADCSNDRIQLFHSGQLIGVTVAGTGAPGTITLDCPTGVALDADKYLFIVDSKRHRIVGSRHNGFRCLVGCPGTLGSSLNQLSFPQSMAFDSYGNMFVTDHNNHRVQKFVVANNTLRKYYSPMKLNSNRS
jgi:sugar lactone lactonase YvrE